MTDIELSVMGSKLLNAPPHGLYFLFADGEDAPEDQGRRDAGEGH